MAGMSLRIMNIQLRPYTSSRAPASLWVTCVGNRLRADHRISGQPPVGDYWHTSADQWFGCRQSLRGVLSLDLSGEIQISCGTETLISGPHERSLLFQGSQTVLTSDSRRRRPNSSRSEATLNSISSQISTSIRVLSRCVCKSIDRSSRSGTAIPYLAYHTLAYHTSMDN